MWLRLCKSPKTATWKPLREFDMVDQETDKRLVTLLKNDRSTTNAPCYCARQRRRIPGDFDVRSGADEDEVESNLAKKAI